MRWIMVVVGALMMIAPATLEDTKFSVNILVGVLLIFCGVTMFLGGLWWTMIFK